MTRTCRTVHIYGQDEDYVVLTHDHSVCPSAVYGPAGWLYCDREPRSHPGPHTAQVGKTVYTWRHVVPDV